MVRALDFAHRWSAEHVARGRLKCLWGVRVAQGAQLVHKPQRAERPLKTEALVFAFVYHRWLRCHSSGWCTSTRHGSQSTISAATRSPPLGAHAIALARSPHQLPALVAWLQLLADPFPSNYSHLSSLYVHGAQVFMVEFLAEAALRRVQQGCQLLLLGARPTCPLSQTLLSLQARLERAAELLCALRLFGLALCASGRACKHGRGRDGKTCLSGEPRPMAAPSQYIRIPMK